MEMNAFSFCRNNGWKHGQGTNNCTKMAGNNLAENAKNASKSIGPICLPKPKSSGFKQYWIKLLISTAVAEF